MGGLVARWYIERCGGHEVTRKLITLGTPWRGATNAIEQLVNGVRKGVGPLSINLTGFARSLPSLHQLMPEFACIANGSEFLKTTETTVPELRPRWSRTRWPSTDLQESERSRRQPGIAHIVVGIRQPTNTTVRLAGGRATVSETFGSENDFGDGTVPLTGAIGHDERLDTNIAVRVPENHSALQCNRFVLDQVQELLTASPVRRRDLSSVSVRARCRTSSSRASPRGGPPRRWMPMPAHSGPVRRPRWRSRSAPSGESSSPERSSRSVPTDPVERRSRSCHPARTPWRSQAPPRLRRPDGHVLDDGVADPAGLSRITRSRQGTPGSGHVCPVELSTRAARSTVPVSGRMSATSLTTTGAPIPSRAWPARRAAPSGPTHSAGGGPRRPR